MDYAPVFYVDGVAYEDDVDITQFIGDPNGGYFVLGAMNDLTTDVYQGDMDDFRIYDSCTFRGGIWLNSML